MPRSSIRLGPGECHTLVMSCYAHAKFTWAWVPNGMVKAQRDGWLKGIKGEVTSTIEHSATLGAAVALC